MNSNPTNDSFGSLFDLQRGGLLDSSFQDNISLNLPLNPSSKSSPLKIITSSKSPIIRPILSNGNNNNNNNTLPQISSRLQSVIKSIPSETINLPTEDIQNRKAYIRSHRLLTSIVDIILTSREEGILPPLSPLTSPEQNAPLDFSLDDFLHSQGLDPASLKAEEKASEYIVSHSNSKEEVTNGKNKSFEDASDRLEFQSKLEQLKDRYKEELAKLNQVFNEFVERMMVLLREQSLIRPISDHESQLKVHAIQQKFDYVRNQLHQNVRTAIITLQRQYKLGQSKRKRKGLPKKATAALSSWFYEHINDPYPTEEDKNALSAATGLTLTQVNNWFGNKRIRFKRKCLEDESKRQKLIENHMSKLSKLEKHEHLSSRSELPDFQSQMLQMPQHHHSQGQHQQHQQI